MNNELDATFSATAATDNQTSGGAGQISTTFRAVTVAPVEFLCRWNSIGGYCRCGFLGGMRSVRTSKLKWCSKLSGISVTTLWVIVDMIAND